MKSEKASKVPFGGGALDRRRLEDLEHELLRRSESRR